MGRFGLRLRQRRTQAAEEEDHDADSEEAEGEPLGEREGSDERLFVFAEKLDDESCGGVEDEIERDHLTGGMALAGAAIEEGKDQQIGSRFVELDRMKRFVERNRRGEIGAEVDTPGKIAFAPPTAAGGETAEASDSLADGDARRKDIHGAEDRKFLTADIEDRNEQSDDEASVEDAGGLQRFKGKDLFRMADVITEVEEKHEELRADDAGHGAVDREIGDLIGRQSGAAREPHGDTQAREEAECDKDAVGGDVKGTDTDEFGIHAATCWDSSSADFWCWSGAGAGIQESQRRHRR